MVSKDKFLKYCERAEKTEKGIQRVEEVFGNISLREQDFCSLSNYADKIAMMLLDIEDRNKEEFIDMFWQITDGEKVEIFWNDTREKLVINNFADFYNYWKWQEE